MCRPGHPARLQIFRLLLGHAPGGRAFGKIGARLNMPASTLRFHLDGLAAGGLAREYRAGRSVICRLELDRLETVLNGFLGLCGAQTNP